MKMTPVSDIINRAAVEVGLNAVVDPMGSNDENFVQLRFLLNSAGQEIAEYKPWQGLMREFSLETKAGDTGNYSLPNDFLYMIDQTGWQLDKSAPVGGPLSAQTWSYLDGSGTGRANTHISFRIHDNTLQLFPQPPAAGISLKFQYMSRNWLRSAADPLITYDAAQNNADQSLLDGLLLIKFLKVKFLDAKGIDSSSQRLEFENLLQARMGHDTGAPVLAIGSTNRSWELDSRRNVPDTNYGR